MPKYTALYMPEILYKTKIFMQRDTSILLKADHNGHLYLSVFSPFNSLKNRIGYTCIQIKCVFKIHLNVF